MARNIDVTGKGKLTKYLSESSDKENNMPISIKARIGSAEEMRTFLLSDFLARKGIDSAEEFHESLAEHSISKRGLGRREAVDMGRVTPSVSRETLPQGQEMSKD